MNEADRVAAQRAAEVEHHDELKGRAAHQRYVERVHRLARELSQLIPPALVARNRDDCRGIEQISYYTRFYRSRNAQVEQQEHKVGAYLVLRVEGPLGPRGRAADSLIYLMSDMRLWVFGAPMTVEEFTEAIFNGPKLQYLKPPEEQHMEGVVNELREWVNGA